MTYKLITQLLTIMAAVLALVTNAGAIAFVQINSAVPQSPQTTVTVPYPSAQLTGDMNVVVVGWNDSTAAVNSVTDTKGNVYQRAVGPTVLPGVSSQSIYFAKNIAASVAGGNAVTVRFNVAALYPDVRIIEYSGLDLTSPVDVTAASTGSGLTSNSGSATTQNASDLIFGANTVATGTRAAGAGFTNRIITSPDSDIAEDRTVTATGSYSVSAPLTSTGGWVMQMVAFKAGLPDLSIAKTHIGSFRQGQTGATYTLTVTNVGPVSTSGTVTVVDTPPAGLTPTALNGTGWSCTLASRTCTRSNSLAIGASYPAITLTVNVAANAPAVVTNTASVSGGGDNSPGNNTANDVTTVTATTTAPSVTINQAAGQADPTNAAPINFTVVFSSSVTGFGSSGVTVSGTAGGTKSAVVTGSGATYSVAVSGMTSTGTVTATVTANAAQDAAGNGNTASTSTDNSVTYDITAPTVTINQAAGQADPTSAALINFTAVFSKPVTGFGAGGVTIGGTAGGTESVVVTGNGATYNVAVSGMTGTGTVVVAVPANAAKDAAGNGNTASTSTDNSVTYLAITASGLVAAYGFNEGTGQTAADASGDGSTGTIVGASWTTAGKYGDALSFNGTGNYVDLGNSASLNMTGSMTVSAWVFATGNPPDDGQIVAKSDNSSGWQLKTTPDTGPNTFGISVSPNGTSHVQRYSNTVRSLNTWYHVAGVYNAAAQTLDIYVNGVLDDGVLSGPVPASQVGSAVNANIGRRTGGFYFQGMIDEVRIYNVALTQAQIQSDMNTPVGQSGTPGPDLTIAKTHTGNFTPGQSGATYTISVANIGTASTSGAVTVTDTLPVAGLSATNLSGTGWNCTLGTLTCTRSDALAAAASYPAIILTVNVASNAPASVTNTVSVSGGGDTSSGNNSATDLTTIGNTIAGLTAAYALDKGTGTSVADSSGNGNAGTIVGAAWTTSGKYGNALSFDGASSYVDLGNAASFGITGSITLSAWIFATGNPPDDGQIIAKSDDSSGWQLKTTPDTGPITFGVAISPSSTSHVQRYSNTVRSLNTWYHVAGVYNAAAQTLDIYVNGVLDNGVLSGSVPASQIDSAANVNIGRRIGGYYFHGTIDEVRIYNAALTQSQIQAEMNTPIGDIPTAPGNLTATAVSGSQISLDWTASTGILTVSGYLVERCQGVACTSFTQIATSQATTYNDTTVIANTDYSYRVRAADTAGDLSPYSNVAAAYSGFSISPHVATLTFTRTQQFTATGPGSASVFWSVDGSVGGTASSGTITTTGLYSPPSSVGTHTVTATTSDGLQSANASAYITNYPGTFTHHNDNLRTGQNLNETVLTPANVNATSFGKLAAFTLDGLTFASPLYAANVNILGQGSHNVVYVATEHDSVYAFDADGLSTSPLWHVSFLNASAGITTVPASDTGETVDIPNELGITGTPVIDPATGTLYVVAKTKEVTGGTTNYVQKLHALDIATGAEKFGGPAVIQATIPGTGVTSQGGQLPFLPLQENQRAALLLNDGLIYIAFASHGDVLPWHGWVFGFNASTLRQVMVYNTSANADGSGIWHGGGGLAADAAGDIYLVTGNGTFDANSGGADYGDSFVKINSLGNVLDYFTPYDQSTLNTLDLDLGSAGLLLLPDQSGPYPHLMTSAGKSCTIYLINRDNMGHYNSNNNSQIVQSIPNAFPDCAVGTGDRIPSVYYNDRIYFSAVNDNIKTFQMSNGLWSTTPTSQSSELYTYPGGSLAISANGNNNGILWSVQRHGDTNAVAPGVLRAYDATNLTTEFYNSDQTGTRDTMDYAAKFNVPLVANGRVYIVGENQLTVYGLLP